MCTVTYKPTEDGFILTSSRDEKIIRKTIKPLVYIEKNIKILYPKDTVANGTWIAANNEKRFACLLNGAFEKHNPKNQYLKSRGLILLESFQYSTIIEFINSIDLLGIEPFTLLLIDARSNIEFIELRWDEQTKHVKKINGNSSQIWSSCTLYNLEIRKKREDLFEKWIKNNFDNNILDFHLRKQDFDEHNSFLMKRLNGMQTVSISQISYSFSDSYFKYFDLIDNVQINYNLNEI